jgi:hypothetical protein
MVTKRATRRKIVAAQPTPTTKSLPTATLGLVMIVLTNYQAEVKQILGLLLKVVA